MHSVSCISLQRLASLQSKTILNIPFFIFFFHFIAGITVTGRVNDSVAITSSNRLEDYSCITETGGTGLLANCVTGLGPTDSDNNTILGGWYFGGSQVTNQGCSGDGVTVLDSEYVGVYQLQQCGTFTTAVEGVYTCVVLNSDMIQESRRLGVYFDGRSKKPDCTTEYCIYTLIFFL